jgi:nitric oxide reductase NorQ protein
MTRNLKDAGLQEGASTRLLIHAGRLMAQGIAARTACQVAITAPLTDDHEMLAALDEMVRSLF